MSSVRESPIKKSPIEKSPIVTYVMNSTILKGKATLVVVELGSNLLVPGPYVGMKNAKPWFIVMTRNYQIIGFRTFENEKLKRIEKIKNIVASMPTHIGEDGRVFMDVLISNIEKRIDFQCKLDANFYGYPEADDHNDDLIDEQLVIEEVELATKFITI